MDFTDATIVVDTNVWLDNFDGVRRSNSDSARCLDAALKAGAQLLYAATSAKDVYYLIAAKLKSESRKREGSLTEQDAMTAEKVAAAYVDALDGCATAVGVDASDIWLARKYWKVHADFEDCLIMAAAKRAKADYILTRDADFLRHSVVPALSPTELLDLLEA